MRTLLSILLLVASALHAHAGKDGITNLPGDHPLPGTALLKSKEDLSVAMQNGAHRLIERMIEAAPTARKEHWNLNGTSAENYRASIAENRAEFRRLIGATDARVPVSMERFGTDENPVLVAESKLIRIYQVRWAVFDRVWAEGLLLVPTLQTQPGVHVVALPDASQLPEEIAGLKGNPSRAWARRLAESGAQVLIPVLLDHGRKFSGNPFLAAHHPSAARGQNKQTHREWIYRQAFHMGRHVIGYEVQKVLAAVDWIKQRHGEESKVGVAGYGEGGLLALYTAGCDERIDATLVSGYFDSRQRVWEEPIYRNVFNLLGRFGDAEIAALIAPRALVVEHFPTPEVEGHKGRIKTPDEDRVRAEVARAKALIGPLAWELTLLSGQNQETAGPCLTALPAFAKQLGMTLRSAPLQENLADRRKGLDVDGRQRRAVRELEAHTQLLLRRSAFVRDHRFLAKVMPGRLQKSRAGGWFRTASVETASAEQFAKAAQPFREELWKKILGKIEEPKLPPRARTRAIYDHPKWTAYDVVLDVYPESFAWGILVLPKGIKAGEQRPVVVCQHGLESVPKNTVVPGHWVGVVDFAGKLAERGFITFAPHNLYRHVERFRYLDRKANTIGLSLYSLIIAHHEQILRWLGTLPQVDADRIGFYGISYGGTTAMFVPSVLTGYCLSICTANLNDWTRMVAGTEDHGYMYTDDQWEMPYFNMGPTFSHAEMAYLIAPRPFMVERGHHDSVARDSQVAAEYAKIRWLYAQLGVADRTEIEFFQGGHCINGKGTFEFLEKHLR